MIVPVCGELTSIVFYAALPAVVIRNKYNLVATARWTGYALSASDGQPSTHCSCRIIEVENRFLKIPWFGCHESNVRQPHLICQVSYYSNLTSTNHQK